MLDDGTLACATGGVGNCPMERDDCLGKPNAGVAPIDADLAACDGDPSGFGSARP